MTHNPEHNREAKKRYNARHQAKKAGKPIPKWAKLKISRKDGKTRGEQYKRVAKRMQERALRGGKPDPTHGAAIKAGLIKAEARRLESTPLRAGTGCKFCPNCGYNLEIVNQAVSVTSVMTKD